MTGQEIALIVFIAVCVLLMFVWLVKSTSGETDNDYYVGKAKLIARFTDEDGCFLCEFEKNGKIVNAIYGFDRDDLKVGDEVDIVWNGFYMSLPHVMDKEIYEKEEEVFSQMNANQGRGTFDNL